MQTANQIFHNLRNRFADFPLYEILYFPIESVLYSKWFMLHCEGPKSFSHEPRRISVAITHYERPSLLLKTLKNIYWDERVSEIVVLDDGSSEDQFLTCTNLLKDFSSKVKLYRREQNLGPFATSIQVCSLCSNPWCILLDSDNTLFAKYLNTIFSLDVWDSTTIYCPDYAFPHYSFQEYSNSVFCFDTIHRCQVENQLLTQNFLFSCLINGGNYFLNVKTFSDLLQPYTVLRPFATDSILRNYIWLSQGYQLKVLNNAWYYHRVHSGSNWKLNARHGITEYYFLSDKFRNNQRATLKDLLLNFRTTGGSKEQLIERVPLSKEVV